MDAADLLLAALDEAGISNELEDIFEPTPTELVEPKATGKPQVVAAPAAPLQPARPVVIPSVPVPQRQHISSPAVQPVVIPQHVTNGPLHTHIKQEPLLKGQLISTQSVTRSSPLTNGPVGTLPKTSLTTGSSSGATVNVPPVRPQKWVSRGKPIPSLHAPVVKEEDGQEETATNNNKPPSVTLVPSASIKQEPVSSHQPVAGSTVKCPPQAPAQPKLLTPPLMTGDVLGGGAASAVSAPASATAAADDIWGGVSDVDMFSQALMQLQQTNAKAAQFEAKIKSKKPEDTRPTSVPTTPSTVPDRAVPDRAAPPSVIKPVIKHAVPTVSTVSLGQATQTKVIPNPRLQVGQLVRTPSVTVRNTLSAAVSNVPPLQHTAQSGTDIISSAFASATGATQPSSFRFASQLAGVPNNNKLIATHTPSGIQSISQAIQNVVKSGNASVSTGQGNPVTIKIIQPPGGQNRILQTRSGSPQSLVIKQVSKPAGNNVVTVTPSQGASPLPQQSVKIMKTADGRTLRIIQTAATSLAQGAGGKVPLANVIATTSQGQKVIITRPASGQQVIGQQLKNVLAQQQAKTVVIQPGSTTPSRIIMKPSPVVTPVRTVSSPLLSSATPGSSVLSPSLPTVIQQKADNGVVKTQLTSKDVSRLWVNEDIKLRNLPSFKQSPVISEGSVVDVTQEVELAEETEELGHAETYAEYVPSKLRIGERHPDPVVETSSLSSVEPVDVWYKLAIPETVIDYGHLSALQLEAITYACQKHEVILPSGERAGFLIGDGAGVGKGRTVAGVIFENYLLGRKRALWLSVSNDLRVDAERDLRDIGAGKIEVYPLNKFKYAKISSKINGKVKKGVIFATYSSLIGESQSGGKYRTRLKQLLHWLSKEFDGVIIFDECHKAKNLCPVGSSKPTKTGMTVLELQRRLPNARIIYASATGASEPKNMAYMTRLGLWGKGTPFKEFTDFIQAVEKRGVGAMELVAMDMKLRGMYIARQLSFHGVTFRVEEVPIPKDFYQLYNDAVRLWAMAREKFQIAAEMMDAEHKMKKSMWGQFWSAHQRFFKYLCISAKTRHCIKLARDATRSGKCVVIGLQSTGEARTLEQLEESGGELNDFVSTAKGVFQTLVEKHFPAPDRKKTFDIFGIGSSLFSDSPRSSPTPASSKKRKKDLSWLDGGGAKKSKTDSSDDSDSDSSKDSGSSGSDSNLSLSESEQEPSDSDNDDFNPFGNGSDSDDDPWLKKVKKPKVEKKKKKPKKEKKKKKKKKKEEKKKAKKPRPKKANMSDSDDDSSDDFADIEEQMDKALEAAGLRGNKETSNSSWSSSKSFGQSGFPGMDAVDKVIAMKRELLDTLEQIGDKLPPNTLDELIDQLGGPDNVAEMTGRKGRVVTNEDGSIQYESRSESDTPLEYLNLAEKQRFMDGDKTVAIISEAASSGISLQADRRAANQRRRVHITLELPWSADRAIQQFGRTHRSNQVSAPEYMFLISELAGERRFAATVAKRLESLGALTHGDRRATESRDLSRFNIDNKYGRAALEAVMKSVLSIERPTVPLPKTYSGNFLQDVMNGLIGVGMISKDNYMSQPMLEKDYNNINKFLNRILGLEIEVQNHLFQYFTETLQAIILEAKRNGRWDMGILDLGSGEENVRQLKTETFVGNFSGSTAKAELHTVSVERGTAWTKAMTVWRDHSGSEDGFYLSSQVCNNTKLAILAVATKSKRNNERLYQVYRPNTGLQIKMETIAEIKKRYKKVLPDTAQGYWQDQYRRSAIQCTHLFTKGSCRKMDLGLPCEIGLRSRTYNILGGSVLSVWNKVEAVLASVPGGVQARMQIIRLRTEEGNRIVGTLIPSNAVAALTNVLKQEATRTYSKHHANYLPDLSLPL